MSFTYYPHNPTSQIHTCIYSNTYSECRFHSVSSKRGISKLIPDEIRESLRKRLIDSTPGKQLNYDEQIELIVSSTCKVWSLGRKKKPWKRPSRRSITRLIKSFNLKRSSTQVQTIAMYSSCILSTPFFKIHLTCILSGMNPFGTIGISSLYSVHWSHSVKCLVSQTRKLRRKDSIGLTV